MKRFSSSFSLSSFFVAWMLVSHGAGRCIGADPEIWFGWLMAGTQELRTVVRLDRSNPESISGTIASPDQLSDALPLSEIQLDSEGHWSFILENEKTFGRRAVYTGKQTATGDVEGTFLQGGRDLQLNLRRVTSLPEETAEDLGANTVWRGTLNLVVRKFDFRIRIYNKPPYAESEKPRVLLDSVNEHAAGIPVAATFDETGEITFAMDTMQPAAKFIATMNPAGDELSGRFHQGVLGLPLKMKLVKGGKLDADNEESETPSKGTSAKEQPKFPGPPSKVAPSKPEPTRAYGEDYMEESFEVVHGISRLQQRKNAALDIHDDHDGIKLVGTLTLPFSGDASKVSSARYPAVIMITGSGPQDRDETIGPHKPFAVIARYLAKHGIASLRYDDRGVGESTGNFLSATSEDFAKDAMVVWDYAATRPEIDAKQIGLLGHSEGGLIAPMICNWKPQVAFQILLAPPGLPGTDVIESQTLRLLELEGVEGAELESTVELEHDLLDIALTSNGDQEESLRRVRHCVDRHWTAIEKATKQRQPDSDLKSVRKLVYTQIEAQFSKLQTPWFHYFLQHDPMIDWLMLRTPTLAIWGEHDAQVLPKLNRKPIEAALERNPSLDATLVTLPELNHLLQTSPTGSPKEYDSISETIAPIALEQIVDWIRKR